MDSNCFEYDTASSLTIHSDLEGTQYRLLLINSDYNVHTEELNSIVLLLDDRLVEDDGVDAALLTGLCDRTFVCP